MSRTIVLLIFATACASVGTVATGGSSAKPPGRLVIVGGALSGTNSAVYRSILDGRAGNGPLCVFPTAGARPDSDMASPVATFNRHGGPGTAIGVLVSSQKLETAYAPAVVEQIRKCSGFWFIGGVQSRVTAAFRPQGKSTPAYEALMQRWREGAVVAGSSAGAAIMSDPMIAGGTSQAAMATGVRRISYIGADSDDTTGGVTLAPGLGFFNAALADQHFLARGRFGRLLTAMLELKEFDLAFGIDENTALIVDHDSLQVIGASGVIVFDERGAKRSGKSAADIKVHLLGDSDRFDLRTRMSFASPAKTKIIPANAVDDTLVTPFARFELLKTLDRFSKSTSTRLVMRLDEGRIVLRKESGFSAFRRNGTGVQDTPSGLGMQGLRLDLIRD
jgi:cyanophycinase